MTKLGKGRVKERKNGKPSRRKREKIRGFFGSESDGRLQQGAGSLGHQADSK